MTQGKCFNMRRARSLRSADCPEIKYAEELGTASDVKPPRCGQCDKRTRLLYATDQATRCTRCNPNEDLPAQFRYCRCGSAVYRWDRSECGQHETVGEHRPVAR